MPAPAASAQGVVREICPANLGESLHVRHNNPQSASGARTSFPVAEKWLPSEASHLRHCLNSRIADGAPASSSDDTDRR